MTTSSFDIPVVHETALSKSLVFTDIDIQSRMNLKQPFALHFEYTRLMMAGLLFQSDPRKILMVGLGGGSLAKYCYQHLPNAHIKVVEINPHVIALRQSFFIPNNDERFLVVQDDAADFVAESVESFDLILVDGFDQQGQPEQLCSNKFYSNCRELLSPKGLMVVNLHRFDPCCNVYLDRMSSIFDDEPVIVQAPGSTNSVVFALKDPSLLSKVTFSKNKPTHMDEEAWQEVKPSLARTYLAVREKTSANKNMK